MLETRWERDLDAAPMPHSSIAGISTARQTFYEPDVRSPASTCSPNHLAKALGILAQTRTLTQWKPDDGVVCRGDSCHCSGWCLVGGEKVFSCFCSFKDEWEQHRDLLKCRPKQFSFRLRKLFWGGPGHVASFYHFISNLKERSGLASWTLSTCSIKPVGEIEVQLRVRTNGWIKLWSTNLVLQSFSNEITSYLMNPPVHVSHLMIYN